MSATPEQVALFAMRLSSFWEGNITLADPYRRLGK